MFKMFRVMPIAAAIAGVFAGNAYAADTVAGFVVGNPVLPGTGFYANAKVCLDVNVNARCDAGEVAVPSDATGHFTLNGTLAPVVAEIGTTATLNGVPVTRALVFRAQGSTSNEVIVSAISTEVQALTDAGAVNAAANLAARLGVTEAQLLENPNTEANAAIAAILNTENEQLLNRIAEATFEAGKTASVPKSLRNRLALDQIQHVVVIFAENRGFDNIYGLFPGVNGVKNALKAYFPQKDRNGAVMGVLPPVWGGVTAAGQSVSVSQAQTTNVIPNAPFQLDAAATPFGPAIPQNVVTRDLYHRFFENQMQIDGGKNDTFVAWADSGSLVMGYYDGSKMGLWNVAKQYVLADNFYQGAFGGSFLNHQYLVCACAPEYPNADTAAAHPTIAQVVMNGGSFTPNLVLAANSPASAQAGIPTFALSGNIAPKNYFGDGTFRAVNTMQPPYQPSGNAPAAGDATHLYANPTAGTTLPPQTQTHIGDLLSAKGLDWAWYSGAWDQATATTTATPYSQPPANGGANPTPTAPSFQFHHQPFNYFAEFDPVANPAGREAHLKDYNDLVNDADHGTLPAVAFYKPQGNLNQHAGYANIADGDAHITALIDRLKASPQWNNMLIVVTYDENGGFWDHAAPPKGDLIGPGTRIPALLVSPYVKKGTVDHTAYDTASVLRFITHRYSLPVLAGLQTRDTAVAASTGKPMGDFTNALSF